MSQSPKMNAFQFLMESRDKVIGRNSPGRETAEPEPNKPKDKLSARKSFLEGWSEKKGAAKRKREYDRKGAFISNKLEERATRLKDMLNVRRESSDFEEEEEIGNVKKAKCRVIDSESENSKDSLGNEDNSKTPNKNNRRRKSKPKYTPSKWKLKIKLSAEKDVESDITNGAHNESSEEKPDDESAKEAIAEKVTNNEEMEEELNAITINESINLEENTEEIEKVGENMEEDVQNSEETSGRRLRPRRSKVQYLPNDDSDFEEGETPKGKRKKEVKSKNKDVPLAPIFLKNATKAKIDPEVLEAKRKFLLSGVPEQLKIERSKTASIEEPDFDVFPKISHIAQTPLKTNWTQPRIELKYLSQTNSELNLNEIVSKFTIELQTSDQIAALENTCSPLKTDLKSLIREIKEANPDYPVFKTFKSIRTRHPTLTLNGEKSKKPSRKSKEDLEPPSFETWPEKYKPSTCSEILSNRKSVALLASWLENWTQGQISRSDDSDFANSEDDRSLKSSSTTNTILLVGPNGCGKTSAVYAICSDFDLKVLEVNASSKRTGKWLVQELQEATQSHQVRKQELSASPDKKCVLLIEDVDVVFDQDDGFASALTQIIATSKRPIILTTNDENAAIVHKFRTQCRLVKFDQMTSIHATYLQIVCLTERMFLGRTCLEKLLSENGGDLRKTLLYLQFWNHNRRLSEEAVIESRLFALEQVCANTLEPCEESAEDRKRRLVAQFKECDRNSVAAFLNSGAVAPVTRWQNALKDSIALEECMGNNKKGYEDGFMEDFIGGLLGGVTRQIDIAKPELKRKHWNYESKLESHLPRLVRCDGKALALDYMPTLRSIARLEGDREATNGKRRNRFYHYLNVLGMDCGDAKLRMYTDLFETH